MITITISAEALAAIEATLPAQSQVETLRDGTGGYFITLPRPHGRSAQDAAPPW